MTHIGIDLHSKTSQFCELGPDGDVLLNTSFPSTKAAFSRLFERREPAKIAVEATGSTPWVEELLSSYGHDVLILGASQVKVIGASIKKTDANDAEVLAHLLSLERRFLSPVAPKSREQRSVRARLSCRLLLVKARTQAINGVRGILRTYGLKVPSGSTSTFSKRVRTMDFKDEDGDSLIATLEPILAHIVEVSAQINAYAAELKELADNNDSAKLLQSIPGIGPTISLAFLTAVGEPERFPSSRQVGAYFGLVPKVRASASVCHMGPITRHGDPEMRRLLVQAAHMHLMHGKDTHLCRLTRKLEARVGRRKALVALARKLAVLMHRMLITGMVYEPHPHGDPGKVNDSQRVERSPPSGEVSSDTPRATQEGDAA